MAKMKNESSADRFVFETLRQTDSITNKHFYIHSKYLTYDIRNKKVACITCLQPKVISVAKSAFQFIKNAQNFHKGIKKTNTMLESCFLNAVRWKSQ